MNNKINKKIEFKARVKHWAVKLDVKVIWLGVRPMRNKWASCSTNGHLNFSTDLLGLEESLWDYVIVHELLLFFRTESWTTLEKPDACTSGGL